MHHKNVLLLLTVMSWMSAGRSEAQPITISEGQIKTFFSPGNTVRIFIDSSLQPVNIGRSGGPNVYDFRNRPFYLEARDTLFSVTQIPQLAQRFPSHAFTIKEWDVTGKYADYPVFSFSNHKLYSEGRARPTDTTGWYMHSIPPEEFLSFPVIYNTQFSVKNIAAVDTTYVKGVPLKMSSDTTTTVKYVDGYGTLLLPGGLTFDCLRLRTVASSPQGPKTFQYWTREGAIVLVNSATSQPDTGVVQTWYILYLSYQTGNRNTRE
jgi:hypothetical protein